jgi:hypothetical protein
MMAEGSAVIAPKRSTVQEQIDDINTDTKRRRHFDSMVTARIRDEMDYLINVKKENKLIVTRLESRTAMPNDKLEGNKWMDELVGRALDYLVKDSSKEIAFIAQGRRLEQGVPTMFESSHERKRSGHQNQEMLLRMHERQSSTAGGWLRSDVCRKQCHTGDKGSIGCPEGDCKEILKR